MKNDEGFTLLEVLIALSLLSGVGFVLLRGFSDSSTAVDKAYALGKHNMLVLRIDDALREELHKVRPPYWLSEVPYERTENGISFPYYNGDRESSLVFYLENDNLVIERKNGKRSFNGIGNIKYDIRTGGESSDTVTVTVTYFRNEASRHTVVFGGVCMRNE